MLGPDEPARCVTVAIACGVFTRPQLVGFQYRFIEPDHIGQSKWQGPEFDVECISPNPRNWS
jgi:hypothetical protein